MPRLSIAIKTTAVLTVWASAATAMIADVETTVDALKPQVVAVVQPVQTPQTVIAGNLCKMPLRHLGHIPAQFAGENVVALACLAE